MFGHEEFMATKTPDEWCEQLGLTIMDRDGWDRGTWDKPLTIGEFQAKYRQCTVDGATRPVYVSHEIPQGTTTLIFKGSGDPARRHQIVAVKVGTLTVGEMPPEGEPIIPD